MNDNESKNGNESMIDNESMNDNYVRWVISVVRNVWLFLSESVSTPGTYPHRVISKNTVCN